MALASVCRILPRRQPASKWFAPRLLHLPLMRAEVFIHSAFMRPVYYPLYVPLRLPYRGLAHSMPSARVRLSGCSAPRARSRHGGQPLVSNREIFRRRKRWEGTREVPMMMSGVGPVAHVRTPMGDPAGLPANGLCRQRHRIARAFRASISGRLRPLIHAQIHVRTLDPTPIVGVVAVEI